MDMKLTRQRKILMAVLGLGLGALVVDRLFMADPVSGPGKAAATPAVAAKPPADAAKTAAAASSESSIPATLPVTTVGERSNTISQRLRARAEAIDLEPASTRDAFRAPPGWLSGSQSGAASRVPGHPLQAFIDRHRLDAVLGDGASGIAIIDGQPYRVGQTVDGMRLVEVHQRSARLASPAGSVELKLSDVE